MAPLQAEQCIEAIAPWSVAVNNGAEEQVDALLRAGQAVSACSGALTHAARRVAEEAAGSSALADGRASIAQLSTWRHANPRARARGGRGGPGGAHPALDLLHPLLVCLEELELELLATATAHGEGTLQSSATLDTLQQVTPLPSAVHYPIIMGQTAAHILESRECLP